MKKITNFQRYLLKLQSEDICFIHIKECLNGNFKWPKDFEEIRQRLLQLFHVLKIGKDCEKTDLQKQQLMLVYLFRQQAHIFLNNHDILMIKKEVDNEIKTLFLIPFALRTIMINLFHSSSGTMHLGRYKTKHLCHNYFDFYNMNSERNIMVFFAWIDQHLEFSRYSWSNQSMILYRYCTDKVSI